MQEFSKGVSSGGISSAFYGPRLSVYPPYAPILPQYENDPAKPKYLTIGSFGPLG